MTSLRRTLSIRFLALLLIAASILGVGTHYLHGYQVKRNARALLEYAEQAKEAKEPDKELGHLARYVGLEPSDGEARARYVLLLERLSPPGEAKGRAYLALDDALRRNPDRADVRRRAAELAMAFGRYGDARGHLKELQNPLLKKKEFEKLVLKKVDLQTSRIPKDRDGKVALDEVNHAIAEVKVKLGDAKDESAEVEARLGSCDEAEGKFEPKDNSPGAVGYYRAALELDGGRVDSASRLANILRKTLNRASEADQVMDELVTANPTSYQARLARCRYCRTAGGKENNDKAEEDLAFALTKLGPPAADVLLMKAGELAQPAPNATTQDYGKARNYYEMGIERYPDDYRFPLGLASLELRAGDAAKAVKWLHDAQRVIPAQNVDAQWLVAGLFIDAGEPHEARVLARSLERSDTRTQPAPLDYLQARLDIAEGEFGKARVTLEARLKDLAVFPELGKQADLLLAQCYEHLGNPDKQLAAYERILAIDPLSVPARFGKASALVAQDSLDKALNEYRTLLPRFPGLRVPMGRLLLAQALRSREVTNTFAAVNTFLEAAPDAVKETPEFKLLDANVKVAAGDVKGALEALERACAGNPTEPNPKEPRYWAARALLAGRSDGGFNEAKALKVLDQGAKVVGDAVEMRLARAACHATRPAATAEPELRKLENTDGMIPGDRARLLDGLADAYSRIGKAERAEQLLKRVKEDRKYDLKIHLRLFDFAAQRKDDAKMQGLVEELRGIEGADGPFWRYAEAVRLLAGASPETGRARQLLAEAAIARPGWSRVRALEGELEELEGHPEAAVEKYKQAVELGDRQPQVLRRAVQLLVAQRRNEEARDLVKKAREQAPSDAGKTNIAAELALLNGAGPNEIAKLADEIIGKDLNDSGKYIKRGQLLATLGKDGREKALEAFSRATELKPESPEAWLSLVLFLIQDGAKDKAKQHLLDLAGGKGKVGPEKLPLVLAPGYEALGEVDKAEAQYLEMEKRQPGETRTVRAVADFYQRSKQWDKAEAQYLRLLEARPNDVGVLQALATFYLGTGQTAKAEPHLRKVIAANTPGATAWARRTLALAWAAKGDYQKSELAVDLIKENFPRNGSAAPEDQRALALVRAMRPGERRESIKTLEESFARLRPTPDEQFLLARLYDADGNWERAGVLLAGLAAPARGVANPGHLAYYVRGLLRNQKGMEAAVWLSKLESVEPNGPRTVELKARVLKEQGKAVDAVNLVNKYAEDAWDKTKNPAVLGASAGLLEELGNAEKGDKDARSKTLYIKAAEKLYRLQFKAAGPEKPDAALALAVFLGRQNQLGEALGLCEQSAKKAPPEVVAGVAIGALRASDPQRGGEREVAAKRIHDLLDPAFKQNPGSETLRVARANLLDAEGRYDEAKSVYRSLIGGQKPSVVALNNLAWLLAVQEGKGDEALGLMEQAVRIAGPVPDLLDTQATVRLARKESRRAVEDLEKALAQGPTASRYFHLTQAHDQAGEKSAARDALLKALALGLSEKDLHPLERRDFKRLAAQLKPDSEKQ